MHSQVSVLEQALLDIVSASDDPEQAWIGCRLIIGVLEDKSAQNFTPRDPKVSAGAFGG